MTLQPIEIKADDKIIIVAPHPDDECIGVGGIISLYARQCDVYVMTDGAQGKIDRPAEEERKVRYKQFVEEMKYAKINKFYWMGYKDGCLMGQSECMEAIDFSKYNIVFLPWGDDNHPDHMATFIYSIDKIKHQKVDNIKVYQYEVHNPMHNCTHFVDISDSIDKKISLIRYHLDQVEQMPLDMMALNLAKYRAGQMGIFDGAYETFCLTDIMKSDISIDKQEREKTIQKCRQFIRLYYRWAKVTSKSSISEYLLCNDIHHISIYGFSNAGKLLYEQLIASKVKIVDIFDKKKISVNGIFDRTLLPDQGNRNVDAVIITVIHGHKEIIDELTGLGYKKVITLQAIIDEIMKNSNPEET